MSYFTLISWTEPQHKLLRARDKQKKVWGSNRRRTGWSPSASLKSVVSSVAWDASASWSASSCVCSSAKGDICTPHQAWHQPTLGRRGLGGHVENNCLLERFVSCWSHIGFVLFTCLPLGFLFMFIIPLLSFIIHRQQLVFLKLCLPPRFTSRHPATDWSLKKDLRHLLLKGYVHCQGGICLRACSTLCSDRIWSWVETTSVRRSLRGKPAGKLIDGRNSGGIVCSFAALCERMGAFIVATKGTQLKWVTVLDSARKESENGQEAIIKEKRYKCR